MAALQVTSPSGIVLDQSFDYAYTAGGAGPVDPGPNLDRVVDNRDPRESRFYFYDALDRLWKSTTLAGVPLYTYAYDANGNRTQETAPAGMTTYSYESATDRIAQASGANSKYFANDVYGSRIWAGPTPYAGLPSHVYNELNRLIEVRDPATQAVLGQYAYDAFGRRVRKITSAGTQLFFYDAAGQLVEERSLSTSPHTVRGYAWLGEEPVGTVDTGPQPTKFAWVHTDRLGTPLAVTSSPAAGNAATIWRASYAPFGLATVNEDPDGDLQTYAMNLRFPGQRWDAESEAHYNFARDYDPTAGRYLVADPLGPASGINSFVYANGDSINWVDPGGLAPFFNNSSHPVVVSGGSGPSSGHAGPNKQIAIAPGQRVSARTPAEGVSDVDSIDFDGDGTADLPESLLDLWPRGEKIPFGDTGPECGVIDNPLAEIPNPLHKFGIGPETFSVGPRIIPYPSGWVK